MCSHNQIEAHQKEDAHQYEADDIKADMTTYDSAEESADNMTYLTYLTEEPCSGSSVHSPLTKAFHWGWSNTIWAALVL